MTPIMIVPTKPAANHTRSGIDKCQNGVENHTVHAIAVRMANVISFNALTTAFAPTLLDTTHE